MEESIPAYRVEMDPLTSQVTEIVTDTGLTLHDRYRAPMAYQEAYVAIGNQARATKIYIAERRGTDRRYLVMSESGQINIIDALPTRPSDVILPPPSLSTLPGFTEPSKPLKGGRSHAPRASTAPAKTIRVKVKVPRALLYGASAGSFLVGGALGVAYAVFL
jgi:hypothetical protein